MTYEPTGPHFDTETAGRLHRRAESKLPSRPELSRPGRRWMGIAGCAAVTIAAVVAFSNVGLGAADDVPPAVGEVDAAVVERDHRADPEVRRPSSPTLQDGNDAAVAGGVAAELEQSPAQIVENEIDIGDRGLEAETIEVPQRPAYVIIQDAIDAGLEERRARHAETSCQ